MTGASPLEGLVERGWILPKPSPLACYQCELPYSGEHWVEAVVADDVWQRISPSGNSGGILCINCMAARLHHLGLAEVEVKLTAGPFCDSHSQLERVTEALRPFAEAARHIGAEADCTPCQAGLVPNRAFRQAREALAAIKEEGIVMDKDVGADPAFAASAVEPVPRLDPPGFNPGDVAFCETDRRALHDAEREHHRITCRVWSALFQRHIPAYREVDLQKLMDQWIAAAEVMRAIVNRALAGETRRAETPKSDSVEDEHATREAGNAQGIAHE